MKRIVCLLLAGICLTGTLLLASCAGMGKAKLGLGVYSKIEKATDATSAAEGTGEVVHTVAAVMVDGSGKILKCKIDAADNSLTYTSDGKYKTPTAFSTKGELGKDYGMKEQAGSTLEWYEQAEVFAKACVGKGADEIKELVAENGKGSEELISAGCTIYVSEFAVAVEKAVKNATETEATAADDLGLGIVSTHSAADSRHAEGDIKGATVCDTTFVALTKSKLGKITAAVTDAISVKFTFDKNGAATTDTTVTLTTKVNMGDNYKMSEYGNDVNGDGKVLEWYEQAKAFSEACIGKSEDELPSLAEDDGITASEELQTAGCTISVSDMLRAAEKAAKQSMK